MTCIHRWLFATPAGPTSKGVCKKCGAETERWNSLLSDRDGSAQFRTQIPRKAPTSVLPITGGKW